MPIWLTEYPIAICGRCSTKVPYRSLRSDSNYPALKVCGDCWDELDPYRLPARQTENISLQYPRPDVGLNVAYYVNGASETAYIVWPGEITILVEPQPT